MVFGGAVQQVGLALTGPLTVGGLTYATDKLTLTYTGGDKTFTATGDATLVIDGQSLTVALGGGNTRGLVVTGGALANLDMTYGGILSLQDLEVQAGDAADPLVIAYAPAKGEYTLTGPIAIETLFGTTTNFGADGQEAVTVRDGALDFDDLNLSLSNVNLGAFSITSLQVAFTPDSFTATLDLMFPGNWRVGGTAGFLHGKLNTIGLLFQAGEAEGIPIPGTGVRISGFSGEVQNLRNPAELVVSGSLTAAWGTDKVVRVTGGFTVSKDELVLDANVNFFDNLSTATGTLTLDWGKEDYELVVDAVWLNGLFTFEAVIDFSDGDELYVKPRPT